MECKAKQMGNRMKDSPEKINHELDKLGSPIFIIRKEPLKNGAILYDKNGLAAAIKQKGQILAILEGEE